MTQGNPGKEADYKKLNITNEVKVTRNELPLHCPTNTAALWCAHPKVYLAIEESKTKSARCPYCGTLYQLVD